MANLVLAFAELLGGAVILDAAIKGDSIANVVRGAATQHPITGLGSSSSSSSTPSSSSSSPGTATVPAGIYINPVPGATLSRTDEGVDYTLDPGKGFVAPGKSQVVSTNAGFFRPNKAGSSSIVLKLLDGPYAGAEYFVAEGIKPAVGITDGAIVQAGQKVADAFSSPYNGIVGNIEAGWWKNGVPLAQSTGGYSEGQVTAAGAAWDAFVRALGGTARSSDPGVHGSTAGLALGAY